MIKSLFEIDLDTGKLITTDGHQYSIDPQDMSICCTWTPTVPLEIRADRGKKIIRNTANGLEVRTL